MSDKQSLKQEKLVEEMEENVPSSSSNGEAVKVKLTKDEEVARVPTPTAVGRIERPKTLVTTIVKKVAAKADSKEAKTKLKVETCSTNTRRNSTSSQSSTGSSYTATVSSDYDEDDDSEWVGVSPRLRQQTNSKGFKDFCIRNIKLAKYGRREIEYAERSED